MTAPTTSNGRRNRRGDKRLRMAPQEQHEGACCRPQTSLESIPTWREQRSKMEAEAATTTDASELDEEEEIVIRPGALRVSMEGVTEPGIGIDEDDGHTQMTITTTAPEEAAPEQNHSLIVAELAPKDRDIDALAAERDALKQSLQAQRDNVAEAEIVEEKTICGFQRKRATCCFVLIAMALVATIAGVTASKKAKGTLIEVTESPTVSLAPSESPSASPTETPLFEIPNPEQCEAIASGNGPTETTGEAYGFFLNIHAFVKNPTTFDDDLSGGLLEKLQSIVAPQIARCPKPNSRRLEDKLDPAKIKTEGGLSKVLIENALFVRVFEGPNSCEEDNTDLCFSFYADLLVLAQTDRRLLVFDFREVVLEALELLGEKIELVERFSLFNMYEVRAASPPSRGNYEQQYTSAIDWNFPWYYWKPYTRSCSNKEPHCSSNKRRR